MYQPKSVITTAAEIRALLGPVFETQVAKIIDHIDPHCQAWIERCPFIVVSSIDATGAMDVSPKGDPPGFVKVLDRNTLAIPTASVTTAATRSSTFFRIPVSRSSSSCPNGARSCASAERHRSRRTKTSSKPWRCRASGPTWPWSSR